MPPAWTEAWWWSRTPRQPPNQRLKPQRPPWRSSNYGRINFRPRPDRADQCRLPPPGGPRSGDAIQGPDGLRPDESPRCGGMPRFDGNVAYFQTNQFLEPGGEKSPRKSRYL